jgi:hypothetical protein
VPQLRQKGEAVNHMFVVFGQDLFVVAWLLAGVLCWCIGLPKGWAGQIEPQTNGDKLFQFGFCVAFWPFALAMGLFLWPVVLIDNSKLGAWLKSTEFIPKRPKQEPLAQAESLEKL